MYKMSKESTKTNRKIMVTAATIIVSALAVSAFSSEKSARESAVDQSLVSFDVQNVAEIAAISKDRIWSSTDEEIDSKTRAAAGWAVCQEALPAYLGDVNASTVISSELKSAIDGLSAKVQADTENWIQLVFGPISDGISKDEVILFANNDRCGFVKANFDGKRDSISSIIATHQNK